ncbi:MAG TPA: hypothetical protein VK453_24430 [Micromonosporaceae bacterium]|nr:hypothetical protein [Micromonosporaceae bacterium]
MHQDDTIDRAVTYAHAALSRARLGNWDAAADTVRRIHVDLGGRGGMAYALVAWCDAYRDHSGGQDAVVTTSLRFVSALTGGVCDASDVAPQVAWAGRLIAARCAHDAATFNALIKAVPSDPRLHRLRVFAVLRLVVAALGSPPRGPGYILVEC